MNIISNIIGTFQQYFIVGGKTGFRLKNSGGAVSVRNYADGADADLKAGTLYDANGKMLSVANADLSSLAGGDIFYFNGITLKRIAYVANKFLFSGSGASNMAWTEATNDPNSVQVSKQSFALSSGATIAVALPSGTHIVGIRLEVVSVYDKGTLQVCAIKNTDKSAGGGVLLDTTDNDSMTAGIYENMGIDIPLSEVDDVVVNITGNPTTGSGNCTIFYVLNPAPSSL